MRAYFRVNDFLEAIRIGERYKHGRVTFIKDGEMAARSSVEDILTNHLPDEIREIMNEKVGLVRQKDHGERIDIEVELNRDILRCRECKYFEKHIMVRAAKEDEVWYHCAHPNDNANGQTRTKGPYWYCADAEEA